jgi:hypothetical protein
MAREASSAVGGIFAIILCVQEGSQHHHEWQTLLVRPLTVQLEFFSAIPPRGQNDQMNLH